MVLATVASAVGHASMCRSDTSIAMTSPARCVGQHVVCACRSNHHSQAHSIPDVCTVEVAFDSRAITSGQKQKPPLTLPRDSGLSAVATKRARAMFDIHDVRCLASPAPEDEVSCFRVWPNGLRCKPPAVRANNQSVLCVQFSSLFTVLQCLFPTFLRLSVNIHKVSRIRNQYLK